MSENCIMPKASTEFIYHSVLKLNIVALACIYDKIPIINYILNLYNKGTDLEYLVKQNGVKIGRPHHFDGCTPLVILVSRGNREAAKALIDKGAKTDVKNQFKYTLLHFAAIKKDQEMFKFLIEYAKVDPHLINANNEDAEDMMKRQLDAQMAAANNIEETMDDDVFYDDP